MTPRALALTLRSLRETTRQKWAYIIRGLLVLGLILAIFVAHDQMEWNSFGGVILLTFVAWGNWLLLTFGMISSFSSLISEEKEQQTLGLLRMAGFTPIGIILGKSAGAILNVLLLLAVQIPFCVLSLTFGGVNVDQIIALFAILFGYAVFGYGVAMLCSSLCARSSTAAAMTMGILLVVHILPGVAVELIEENFVTTTGGLVGAVHGFFFGWSESLAMYLIARLTGTGSFGTISYGLALSINVVVGLMLLGAAWVVLYRAPLEASGGGSPARGLRRLFQGARVGRRFGAFPILQKDYALLSGGPMGLLWRGVFYLAVVGVIYAVDPGSSPRHRAEMIMGWGVFFLVLEAGLQAERVFRSEVREQTWGVLYALPVEFSSLVWSKLLGAFVRILPAMAFLFVGFCHRPRTFFRGFEELVDEPVVWMFGGQILFGLMLTTWLSLGNARGALARAVAVIVAFNFGFGLMASVVRSMDGIHALAGTCALLFFGGCVPLVLATGRRLREVAGSG